MSVHDNLQQTFRFALKIPNGLSEKFTVGRIRPPREMGGGGNGKTCYNKESQFETRPGRATWEGSLIFLIELVATRDTMPLD